MVADSFARFSGPRILFDARAPVFDAGQ